jgi:hypothetical protein
VSQRLADFVPYPKTPRLRREVVLTEKIDGTNAAVQIVPAGRPDLGNYYENGWTFVTLEGRQHGIRAQSRKRLISLEEDNFGFARWVHENAVGLISSLDEGTHFGEWWGSGIQCGYGLPKGEKRFSLFNVNRWQDLQTSVPGLGVVPVLATGTLSDGLVDKTLQLLRETGSVASPGFMSPEGIIVFHTAAQQVFKVLLEQDEIPKGLVSA